MSQDKPTNRSRVSLWLDVAGLVTVLRDMARHGQSSLVKIDGLRDQGKTYTVVLDGPVDRGPNFRGNAADLGKLLEQAIRAVNRVPDVPCEDPVYLHKLASLLEQADAIARSGAFVALRMDCERKDALYQVSLGGEFLGKTYFDEGGNDLPSLMLKAVEFYRSSASPPASDI